MAIRDETMENIPQGTLWWLATQFLLSMRIEVLRPQSWNVLRIPCIPQDGDLHPNALQRGEDLI